MKSRTSLILFCSFALVHLAAQFAALYAWLGAYEQDPVQYDALKDFAYFRYLAAVTFPGSRLIDALPEPRSLAMARAVVTAVFALNSLLWSGVVWAVFRLCLRAFRSHLPPTGRRGAVRPEN